MADDEIVAEPVELAGGGARAHMRPHEVERRRRQVPGAAHACEFAGVVQLDLLGPAAPAVGYFGDLHRVGGLVSDFGSLGSDWPRRGKGHRAPPRRGRGRAAAAGRKRLNVL